MTGRIVIVDDSLTVRMDLGEAFREAGYQVRLCASAAEARAAIAEEAPALVILDVVLPDADGVDLLVELRGRPDTAGAPVVMLSSEAEVEDRVRGLSEGADEYVGKPYDASYVIGRCIDLLRRRAERGAARSDPTVLVIDDSVTYRERLAEVLRGAGYRAVLAASGEEGLRRAADLLPDAVIVDGVMPGLDGTAVIRRIRLDPGLRATPCLLLTASEVAAREVAALDAGADAYVRKTETTDVVLARLAAVLRTARDTRERAHAASLLGPRRILAVDDSPTYLDALAEQLRADGYEVVTASSGEEALERLGAERVDCILLDVVMPGLSGTETCRRIKAAPVTRHVPLILLTALADQEAMIEGINAGADDYVLKSADLDVLQARLRAQLRRKHFEDENRRVREELLRKEAEAQAAAEVAEARAVLLARLEQQNAELELLNRELRMFAYSVSHDLRQPIRSMDGFSKALLERYADRLDERGRHYLERVRAGAQRMGELIDGMLVLSRASTRELQLRPIRLDELARRAFERLRDAEPERDVELVVAGELAAEADAELMESALENLLGNAWKFTARRPGARIEVGRARRGDHDCFFVADNGVGFDMAQAHRLFAPFQRLHADGEYAGTGIGLATVQRIIHRHGGEIWAEGEPGRGATFRFTLGSTNRRRSGP